MSRRGSVLQGIEFKGMDYEPHFEAMRIAQQERELQDRKNQQKQKEEDADKWRRIKLIEDATNPADYKSASVKANDLAIQKLYEIRNKYSDPKNKMPIDEYDNKSKDKVFMQRKLKELTTRAAQHGDDNLFNSTMGQIFVKEFPSGTCSVEDVDNHIKHLEENKGIKIDMVVLDYLTIMQPEKGDGTLFSNGKYLSNGLRAIAQVRDLVMVTAMQIGKDAQNAPEINMSDISESKAIYENADCIFGIIRTDAMRRENKYILKLLKLRNGSFKWEKTHFELDPVYLNIRNDKKLDFN
jgi:hypothetical protein